MSDQEQLVQIAGEQFEGPLTNVGTGTSGGLQGVGATGPSQPTMPVVTQPRYVPLQEVPYQRSLHEQLALFNFSPESWSVFRNLDAQHGGDSRAVSLVHGGLRNVIATAGNARPESLETNEDKYRKLIGGVLLSGERLTGNQCFDFSKVEFQHILDSKQGVTAQPKPAMVAGRIYLTNQRLLLLSAGNVASLQLTDNANTGAPLQTARSNCKVFSVTGNKTSSCRYESIPLADIRGVDMSSIFSGTSSTNIKGIIPQQPMCSCCCPMEENWEESPLISSTNLLGVVNVGVLLPPWQTKCNVLIFMPQNSETASGVALIQALQYAAPAFQSSPGN